MSRAGLRAMRFGRASHNGVAELAMPKAPPRRDDVAASSSRPVMDDDASALAPEWLDEPAWWGGRACDALPRPPSPPAAPLTPAPESPEVRCRAARCRCRAAPRPREPRSRGGDLRRFRRRQAQMAAARADAHRFAEAVLLLREVRKHRVVRAARSKSGAAGAPAQHRSPRHAEPPLCNLSAGVSRPQENAALKQQLERALVAREDAFAQQRVRRRVVHGSSSAASLSRCLPC